MFNSQVLEIAIGLVFVYLIASLLVTVVRELVESVLKTRAVQLERGLRLLLDDPTGKQTTAKLFSHPQIFSLFDGVYDPNKLTGFFQDWKRSESIFNGDIVSGKALRLPLGSKLPSYIVVADRKLTSGGADKNLVNFRSATTRLVHHSTILEMNVESYRRRAAQAVQDSPARKARSAT